MRPLKIGIVVGEHSGEKLAVALVKEIKAKFPGAEIYGVVGKELTDLGCQAIAPMSKIAIMGFIEPLMRLPELIKLRSWVAEYFLVEPPDVFIGVDAPDFNLYIETKLRQAGIPTVHYVSPSVWAWRQGRIKTIVKAVDLMLTLYPFETKFYDKFNVASRFVGHPAADQIPLIIETQAARDRLGISSDKVVLGILPGSRAAEINEHLAIYLLAAEKLWHDDSNIIALVPAVDEKIATLIDETIAMHKHLQVPIKVITEDSWGVMSACDFAIVTSGTATLELMLHKKPMVIAYKMHWFNYYIAKLLVKVKNIGLPNLVAESNIVVELIQKEVTPALLYKEVTLLKQNHEQCNSLKDKFLQLHKLLKQDASKQAARAIFTMLSLEMD